MKEREQSSIAIRLVDGQGQGIGEITPVDYGQGIRDLSDFFTQKKELGEVRSFAIDSQQVQRVGQTSRIRISVPSIPGRKTRVSLDNREIRAVLSRGNKVLVVPKEEFLVQYQWIDFYEIIGNVVNTDIPLVSFRLDRKNLKVMTKNWYGPEKQRFIDFLDGVLDFKYLEPFSLTVNGYFQVCVFEYKKPHRLSVKSTGYVPGEQVTINPKLDDEGHFVLEVCNSVTGDNPVRFIYDPDRIRFAPTNIDGTKRVPSGYWTPEQIENTILAIYQRDGEVGLHSPHAGRVRERANHAYPGGMKALKRKLGLEFSTPDGWITNKALADRVGRSEALIRRMAEKYRKTNTDWFQLYSIKGRFHEHYSPELVSQIRKRLETGGQLSPEQANEQLRKILKGVV